MAKKPQLTTKDLSLLNDLLVYEQSAVIKNRQYASTLTDPDLKNLCNQLISNHTSNFNALYNLL